MGGTKATIRFPKTCYATLRGIIDYGVRVMASCDHCGLCRLADIPALVEKLGLDGTLVDRHPPCPTPGCKGWILFAYSTAPGTMFRPMTTGRRSKLGEI